MAASSVLGGMAPALFLKRHWQKRPLLIRNAFPGFQDPVTRDELAGLACEEGVASRLVMERGGAKPWQVFHGPQKASRLRRLPRSHWTLLVQGVDRHVPGVAALAEAFRFIPDWRIEDVMISFAPRAGSVGPHVDSYDVFLLQGAGRRRWGIAARPDPALRPGLDLRILKTFRAEREWVLGPGDMLYLPPGVAHHGVALGECLTYSIGFRAPSAAELLAAAIPRVAAGSAARYSDPSLRPARNPGEIPPAALRNLRRVMEDGLRRMGRDDFAALAGELLTEPKEALPPGPTLSPSTLRARLLKGAELRRAPGARLAFTRRGASAVLFAEGRAHPLPPPLAAAAPLLCGGPRISAAALKPFLARPGFLLFVARLIEDGVVTPAL